MRKHLVIALTLLTMAFGVNAYAVDRPADNGIIKRPDGGRQSQAVKVYKLVRNSSQNGTTGVISIGSVVVWDTVSDDGISVRMTTTSRDGAIAGIAVTLISPDVTALGPAASDDEGKGNWGYIQVHGNCNALTLTGGTNGNAAGNVFITSSDAGNITTFRSDVGNSDAIAVLNTRNGGFFYDATGTASSGTSASVGQTQVDVFVTLE